MILYEGIGELLTLDGVASRSGRHVQESDLGVLRKAALLVQTTGRAGQKGRVAWVGARKQLPKSFAKFISKEVDLGGQTVVPGFVECHTHLVFAGERSGEFEMRNSGVSYQEIAARGGGILSTMTATRQASKAQLLKLAQGRADRYVAQGVTTLESKTGYALNQKDELKMLEVNALIKGPRLVSTFLGAHAKPPEFATHAEYLEFLTGLLPLIRKRGLATRVDAFIENGFFEVEATRHYLKAAKALGFDLGIHADQLTLSGGTDLAIELGAKSADHVIQIGKKQIKALAESEVTAVALPAADLYMKCAYPPARQMIEAGGRVALATDFNPGSSPTQDLSLVGLLARLQMKMSLPEVIAGLTYNPACALGLESETGSLQVGKSADFAVVNEGWQKLFYSVGYHPVTATYQAGRRLFQAS